MRLAGLAGVGLSTVVKVERGKIARLQVESVVRIARVLGVSVVELIPGFGVRESEGGRALKPREYGRAGGPARRALVIGALRKVLSERGGRMVAAECCAVVRERYGVAEATVRAVRGEAGILSVRLPERGRRRDAWEWRLEPQPTESAVLPAPPAH